MKQVLFSFFAVLAMVASVFAEVPEGIKGKIDKASADVKLLYKVCYAGIKEGKEQQFVSLVEHNESMIADVDASLQAVAEDEQDKSYKDAVRFTRFVINDLERIRALYEGDDCQGPTEEQKKALEHGHGGGGGH